MKYCYYAGILTLLLGFAACTRRETPPPAFYYWKTTINLDSTDKAFLSRMCWQQPLYLRLFDVDHSAGYGGPVPAGDLSWEDGPVDQPIIPVVFLTNRTFQQLPDSAVEGLARKVHQRIADDLRPVAIHAVHHIYKAAFDTAKNYSVLRDSLCKIWLKKVPEVQFDCDWTATTRERYFHFLRAMKQLYPDQRVSCTVRLHQYRDRQQTGVPPVDRGTLMCYNTGDPRKPTTRNAILDIALVKGYLKAAPYPLPLDVALPLFSWGTWFRNGEFRGLLQGWDADALSDPALFRSLDAQHFQVRRDTVIDRDYLREGDEIRLDAPDAADLEATAALLRKVKASDGKVIFFDFQPKYTSKYEQLVKDCMRGF